MVVQSIKGKMDYIDVYFDDGKVVRILGELLSGGFCAEERSIQRWKTPEGKIITESEKKEIIESVKQKTKGSHMVIAFE